MGATASKSQLQLRDEIEVLETALVATQRPIDFDDEASAGAHSALNTMRNAYYHRQSSRCRRLRSAAVKKFVCKGGRLSASAVRFDADVMDIDTRELLTLPPTSVDLPLKRVPADLCAPAPPTAFLFARKLCRTRQHGNEYRGNALRIVVAKQK